MHTSRLRQKILAYFPYMTACMSSREKIFQHNGKIVSDAMLQACKDDHDDDVLA